MENKPITEIRTSLSTDGKYLVHKTIITDIRPVSYYLKLFDTKLK
jgi:hypothetical protein